VLGLIGRSGPIAGDRFELPGYGGEVLGVGRRTVGRVRLRPLPEQ
jgi:hypothetical protein